MRKTAKKKQRAVAFVVARHKSRAKPLLGRLVRALEKRGIRSLLDAETAAALKLDRLAATAEQMQEKAELFVALGGDGTLLATARQAAPAGIPILGVNLGGFGFLAEVAEKDALFALEAALAGECRIEERLVLEAQVFRSGEQIRTFHALNDVVISKGAFSRMLRLRTSVDGHYLSGIPADGLLVATPTGSTGYSLSAGGPVVDPRVQAMLLLPICPHTLSQRPLVASADQVLEITVPALQADQEAGLTVDGQIGFRLDSHDRVRVKRAEFAARLVAVGEPSFYRRLRTKLKWGGER